MSDKNVDHATRVVFLDQQRLRRVSIVASSCARLVSRPNVGGRATFKVSTSNLAADRVCGVEVCDGRLYLSPVVGVLRTRVSPGLRASRSMCQDDVRLAFSYGVPPPAPSSAE
jgi:hypothetical protein